VRKLTNSPLNARHHQNLLHRSVSFPGALAVLAKAYQQSFIEGMPMPTGANPKREREYKKLERKFKKEGRYAGREDEVAARIVNKQRAQTGEAKHSHRAPQRSASRRKSRGARSASRRGKS